MLSSKTLVFAHGLSIHFGLVKPSSDCDVILAAPHGPGLRLREKYLAGEPFTAFVGIGNKSSRKASEIARAYAEAIGCPRKLQFESTFRDETIGDIFGEQAVLCGGLVGLMESGFETLVRKGLSEETAYLECIYQIDLIVDLIKKFGPAGMFERISATAAFGSLRKKEKLFGSDFRRKLNELYNENFKKRMRIWLISSDAAPQARAVISLPGHKNRREPRPLHKLIISGKFDNAIGTER